jgi:hypothetical protein
VSYPSFIPEGDDEGVEAQRALASVLSEALAQPEIIEAMHTEGLSANEARLAVRNKQDVLARIRAEQVRVRRAMTDAAVLDAKVGTSGKSPRLWSARDVVWLTLALSIGIGYLSLLRVAWPVMPWVAQAFCVLGFISALLVSARIAVRKAPTLRARLELALGEDDEALGLGERRGFVLNEIVLPELRQYIHDRRRPVDSTTLITGRVRNLYAEDVPGDTETIMTSASLRLRRILQRSESGAVALAGHRGVGKTTAIRSIERGLFSDPSSPLPLAVVADAPARYDARDFVLHLHAQLCRAVLARITKSRDLRTPEEPHDYFTKVRRAARRRERIRRIVRHAAGYVVTVVLAVLTGIALSGWSVGRLVIELRRVVTAAVHGFPDSLLPLVRALSDAELATMLIFVAVVVYTVVVALSVVVGMISGIVLLARQISARGRDDELSLLKVVAEDQFNRIRFLQTYTTGWSGKINMPLRGEVGRTQATQRAEQQLTHPEVVREFRRFAELCAGVLRANELSDRIVVAVDELDKIGEVEHARTFVNDIKGVFGVPGCMFVVSVSDDAITTFEQRGIAVRDAFDSAFTEMVRMQHFTLDESRLWISRRLLGIPEQFCYLCHCLSGGLPRDLRRYTIDMVDITMDTYDPDLATVTTRLLEQELAAKSHAFSHTASALAHTLDLSELLDGLSTIPTGGDPQTWIKIANRLVDNGRADPIDAVGRLRWQSGTFVLFCATIRQVFTNELTYRDLADGNVATLSTARRSLASDPILGWRVLNTFRAGYGLPASETEYQQQ